MLWLSPFSVFLLSFDGVNILAQQANHVVSRDLTEHVGILQQGVGHAPLVLVQADDFLLNGSCGNEPIDGDRPLLSNAVGAVAGLVLNGWVPPGIKVYHKVGSRQVESQSASLQADEEQRLVARLELLDQLVALLSRCAAV